MGRAYRGCARHAALHIHAEKQGLRASGPGCVRALWTLPSSAIAHQRRLKRSESTQGEVGEAVTGEVHQKRLGSRACGTQTALKTDRGVLRHTWTPGQKISKTGSSQLQAGTPPGGHRGCSKISHHQANSSLSKDEQRFTRIRKTTVWCSQKQKVKVR